MAMWINQEDGLSNRSSIILVIILVMDGSGREVRGNSPFAICGRKGKLGCIDQQGKVVIKPRFDRIYVYEGVCFVQDIKKYGKKWGIVDERGSYIVTPRFESVNDYWLD